MKIVSGFRHTPGIHCGSTALRDQLQHIGLDYSEALCFGLGSGLGFTYLRNPRGTPPSRLFHGRTLPLERDLCRHLGLRFVEGAEDDTERAWSVVKSLVDADTPVLLSVELSQLPYWRTRTPFPGHRVLLVGYDEARQVALLADTGFPDLQEIPYAALRAARSAQVPPLPLHNEWLAIQPTPNPVPLADAIPRALRDNALGMNLDRAPYQGIMGMESVAEEFESWADLPDWEFCARMAYQNIEVRGTGGGMFRKMYAQYLQEAEALIAPLQGAKLAETMDEIAAEWSGLASILQRIAVERNAALYKEASRALRRLALREENFWGRVLNIVGRS